MNREERLRREIDLIEAVTAEFEAAAGDLLIGSELSRSSARALEEVIELLGVNYVGPEMLGRLLYGNENKFSQVELDYVKLEEILNELDEWESDKKKYETYALVYKPPVSFLELRDRANEVASAQGKSPVFLIMDNGNWYMNEAFATQIPKSGCWELVRRETVPGSTDKVLDDQKALIADKPNLATTSFPARVSLLVGKHLAHDIKLYDGEWHYGRTSASGGHVLLGYLNADGAYVNDSDEAHAIVGLSVTRNLN